MKKIFPIIYLISVLVLAPIALAGQALIFTDRNVDFWGYMPGLKIGDTVTAYDPDGVMCGAFTVKKEGAYGFLHVYGDDVLTKTDNGASPGDTIRFLVNGVEVLPAGPDNPVWTKDGDRLNVNFKPVN